jgi:RES domain
VGECPTTIFASETRKSFRFIRSGKSEQLLNLVRETMGKRLVRLPEGKRLARAQIGFEWRPTEVRDPDDDTVVEMIDEPWPYPSERMYPTPEYAGAGRVNPKGIPCLYLSFEKETAVYEIRPWLNAVVSLGLFETTRELSIVDCARKSSLTELLWTMRCWECVEDEEPTPKDEELEEIVWGEINSALSQPVQKSDDPINYIPTQILCELFKVNGADGIAYKSSVRKGGH